MRRFVVIIPVLVLSLVIQYLPSPFASMLSQLALSLSTLYFLFHFLFVTPFWFQASRREPIIHAGVTALCILLPLCTPYAKLSLFHFVQLIISTLFASLVAFRDASCQQNIPFLLAIVFILTHLFQHAQLSPVLTVYYMLTYFCSILLCLKVYDSDDNDPERWRYFTIHQSDENRPVPANRKNASLIELLTFDWVTETVSRGRRQPLEMEDVPSINEPFSCRISAKEKFEPLWRKEIEKGANGRLIRALWHSFGLRLTIGGVLKLINDMLLFVSPLLLKYIIQFAQRRQHGEEASVQEGVLLAFSLFVSYLAQSLLFHQYFDMISLVQIQLRGALTNAVFEKSCRLAPESRVQYTSGQIQNLMSTDVRTVADVVLVIHMLWSSIIQVFVALILLVNLLGWIPTAAGLVFLLATMPLQAWMVTCIKHFRELASRNTDERVKVVSEAMKGIKLVKLYAWELSFVRRILEIRAVELYFIRLMMLMQASCSFLISSLPTSLTIVAFVVYALAGNTLNSAVVFPAIALFNILRPPLLFFPSTIINTARAAASLSRLRGFLTTAELDNSPTNEEHAMDQTWMEENDIDIALSNASFSWDPSVSTTAITLANASFNVPRGSLVVVVGPTGGGKSTLLAGLLGEVPIVSGHVGLRQGKNVSYCDQVAFIRNETVRGNILFGKPFDAERYEITLEKCSLKSDLDLLPAGDLTEIGGRGVNLSGGQRARISLARAVYSGAEICLMDDPLCAVDARVGKALFKNCIVSELRGKTRILTTNQLNFAASPDVDLIVVIKNGVVIESGTRDELLSKIDSEFVEMVNEAGDLAAVDQEEDDIDEPSPLILDPSPLVPVAIHDFSPVDSGDSDQDGDVISFSSSQSSEDFREKNTLLDEQKTNYGALEAGKLTHKEKKSVGRVQVKHYQSYLSNMGMLQWVVPLLLFGFASQAFSLIVNLWLSMWSDTATDPSREQATTFLVTFIALGVITLAFAAGSEYAQAFGSVRASILIHEKLLLSVFGAPSSFFSSTPEGRLINRFNSDMDNIDSLLASTLQSLLRLLLSLVFTLGIILWVTPTFIFFVVPVGILCLYIQEFYRKSSVDLRRLESLSRSPLYSHFGETLDGVATIRAYKDVSWAVHKSDTYTDHLSKASYATQYANRWIAIRLEGLGTILVFSATLLALLAPVGKISASVIGLVLAYVMQILGGMTWSVRQFTETESQMNAIERVAEFSEHPFPQEEKGGLGEFMKELEANSGALSCDDSMGLISIDTVSQLNQGVSRRHVRWPKRGRIEFKNVEMRYRKDLDPALRQVSFTVEPGEHVGIVGRTGAGKSSAIQSLFRLYEPSGGRILIDGVDISSLRLFDLRSSLGIIPQEPICFSGTIRSNLDMFNEHSDESVQGALDACGLQTTLREKVGLYTEVAENGSNFSVGQRQLLCLGRALLKDSQILVLDEATSSVSHATDEKFQNTLHEEMSQCTVLTVAHRLHTVIQYDKIIVMDKGRIVEMGRPCELLRRRSRLGELVDETGAATAKHLRQLAMLPRGDKGNKMIGRIAGELRERELPTMYNRSTYGSETIRERVRSAFAELKAALVQADTGRWGLDKDEYEDESDWKRQVLTMAGKLNAVAENIGVGSQPSLMMPSSFEALPGVSADLLGRGSQQEGVINPPRAGLPGREKLSSSEDLRT